MKDLVDIFVHIDLPTKVITRIYISKLLFSYYFIIHDF